MRNVDCVISNFIGSCDFIDPRSTKERNGIMGWGRILINEEQTKEFSLYNKFTVNVTKFSQIFTENRPIDLFVLDVEGNEVQALEGILEIPKEFYPEIFCIEKNGAEKRLDDMLSDYYTLDYETEVDRIYKRK